MKPILYAALLFLNLNLFSQTYILDSSFGNSGTMRYASTTFAAKKGLLINNNYYFISSSSIAKINYSGQIVTGFGSNGYKLLTQANETLYLSDFIFQDNFFYIYGKTTNNTTGNVDIFICKIDESGNFDSSFGANGIVKLDFGLQETISGLLVEPTGSLYCIGTRFIAPESSDNSSLLLFKINANGSVNTTFNAAGYKEITLNIKTTGASIIPYNNSYLVLGSTKVSASPFVIQILITEVDANGTVNTSFGSNGFKTIPFAEGGVLASEIHEVQLLNNTLFMNLDVSLSWAGLSRKLSAYNLDTDQTLFYLGVNEYMSYNVSNDGILLSDYCVQCCATGTPSACDNTFKLKKLNLDGSLQTSFHLNGLYSYEFNYGGPFPTFGDSRPYVFIKGTDGKILIAGFVYAQFGTNGFSAIRISEGALGLDNLEASHNIAIFPNPFTDKIYFKPNGPIKAVEVYDFIGRKIAEPELKYESGIAVVGLSKITQKGTYLMKIITEEGEIITEKIIKN